MVLMFPFRRTFDRSWNSFIVRYGPTGTEESFLDREPPGLHDDLVDKTPYKQDEIPGDDERLGETWKAKRDGELFIYLNKPVLGIWGLETWLSRNWFPSTGKAVVTIGKRP